MRALLLVLLLLLSAPVSANWVRYGETDSATFYFDLHTVKARGALRRVWELSDQRAPGELHGERSRVALFEYDCKGERHRVLQVTAFTEAMGTGRVAANTTQPSEWEYIAPGTVSHALLKTVCALHPPAPKKPPPKSKEAWIRS